VLFVEQRFKITYHFHKTPAKRELCTVDMVGVADCYLRSMML
jgi:hypothetical protein